MKVRHIRRKPWLTKGPGHRAGKRAWRSVLRQSAHRKKLIEEAFRRYARPVI